MTHDDYRIHLLICEFLGREPTGKYEMVHDFLTDLWEDMELSFMAGASRDFFISQKDGIPFFYHSPSKGRLTCCITIMNFFEKRIGMDVYGAKQFIKNVEEEHLKCQSIISVQIFYMGG